MACKYLSGLRIPGCLASEKMMYPSVFELITFCKNDYQKCLIYQMKDEIALLQDNRRKVKPAIKKIATAAV